MKQYFLDVGWQSHNKSGELLCGDQIEIVHGEDDRSLVMVLADGLGSGVKANILSTLTAKIISTMMANGMNIEECVSTVAAALPVCDIRKIAYSTFTIIRVGEKLDAEIIQFDNPHVILFRDGKKEIFPETLECIDGKNIYKSHIQLIENDVFMAISDGVVHAGVGNRLNLSWDIKDIVDFMERLYREEYTAKVLATMLCDHCLNLYAGDAGDDATVCMVKVKRRNSMSLMIGPPVNPKDVNTMMSLFFSKEGKHIVCGGTTSQLAADFLGKTLCQDISEQIDPEVPPMASIEGVDIVTEGVVTFSKALRYAEDYLANNDLYMQWSLGEDGASCITRSLIEEATDINFYVGRAANPAHQNPDLPLGFSIKMRLVDEFSAALRKMGKRVKVSYF